ncbi:methicillin resistance protein [Luteitalea sp. TBR-22]|uniref:lipid II:glycine glycyltransferase FemX n=1 Tax=Luteitalea sp. TBR-22 TaxID=2802971 RepID=UPI001AF235A8|nr:GNAT family N-acetyltransferase [Luteitalea sp. TBR-22]BCS36077.1 methicillin resistance protein [Luteitalea sp. TBR-22]
MNAPVHTMDPLADRRWDAFVARHPRASVFHGRHWLEALQRTYGYRPFVLTTTDAGPLANGLVACEVRTTLARRLVSLPFSDHADVLADDPAHESALCEALAARTRDGHWRSVEVRGQAHQSALAAGATYAWHVLDLQRTPDEIFGAFHPSSTRRAIRRAEREGLVVEVGRSEALLGEFFALLRQARRRHGVPPQPLAWFRNLSASFGDRLSVYVARKAHDPVAAILTLRAGTTLVYKYGGSDARHHALGGMPLLFWTAIRQARADGAARLDLGRSDLDQPGLIAFKDHLGAEQRRLTYLQWPAAATRRQPPGALGRAARRLLAHLPDPLFDLTGRLAYRHLG